MGQRSEPGVVAILSRLWKYSERVLDFPDILALITDARQFPQIPTQIVSTSAWAMFSSRLGSLNALEQTNDSPAWKRIIGESPPSADTMGRVVAKMDSVTIRSALYQLYLQFKRNKALQASPHGLIALAIDGHETSCSLSKSCSQCLERNQHGILQYYHRNVTAQLVFENFSLLIDAELQAPGDNELTTAKRLYERVARTYSRAFDVVIGDALYCTLPFIKLVLDSGKDIIAVLKANAGAVLDQANHILDQQPIKMTLAECGVRREIRETDEVAFGLNRPMRIIRSEEQKPAGSKRGDSTWLWVTSLNPLRGSTQTVVALGHDRWKIENLAFNETTNRWYSDHVYRHDPGAILNFWLLCMLSFNTFMCFFFRNLKLALRLKHTMLHVSKALQSELYAMPVSTRPP